MILYLKYENLLLKDFIYFYLFNKDFYYFVNNLKFKFIIKILIFEVKMS